VNRQYRVSSFRVSKSYRVPTAWAEVELEVKKSRFIACGAPVSDEEGVRALIADAVARYPHATHHCSAYVLGMPSRPQAAGSNDDGEPSGTAGRPMLNLLLGQQIGGCAVVVTRYFGGIKLGAGGLVRAYSGAVRELIQAWPMQELEPQAEIRLVYPYNLQPQVDALLQRFGAQVLGSEYGVDVRLQLGVAESVAEAFCNEAQQRAHLGMAHQLLIAEE